MKKNYRNWIYSLIVIGASFLLVSSCNKDDDDNNPSSGETVEDIDGNVYHTVTIGTQVWLVENLKTTKYRNGDPIPNVTDYTAWRNLTTGAQCNYNNDAAIGNKYGKLYNWYAANDSRNIAPPGWHVSNNSDWSVLYNYVNANLGTSGLVVKALASKTDWSLYAENIGGDITKNNSSGFTALPGGKLNGGLGSNANWWIFGEYETNAVSIGMGDYDTGPDDALEVFVSDKTSGLSVRCVKD